MEPVADAPHLFRQPDGLTACELAAWDALCGRVDIPDPHCCGPDWQLTAFSSSRRAGAPILVHADEDSLVALTLTRDGEGYRLGPLEAHWGFGSPVLGMRAAQILMHSVGTLRPLLPGSPLSLVLPGLSLQSPQTTALAAAFPDHELLADHEQVAASLEGGFDGWLSRRSVNFRRNLRRGETRARHCGITFERVSPVSPQEAEAIYTRMLEVESRSWKGARGEGLFRVRAFYARLLAAYASKRRARIVMARQAGRDIGFCFGGASAGIYRGQQTSFDESHAENGIGNLMHVETARWLCEDGFRVHHFGPVQRGMGYKHHFCEITSQAVTMDILL